VKAEVSVDREAFSAAIAGVNVLKATITTHRAALNVLISKATTLKWAFTDEEAHFTRDKGGITTEDVPLSRVALAASVLAAPSHCLVVNQAICDTTSRSNCPTLYVNAREGRGRRAAARSDRASGAGGTAPASR
jgi:hypothetical protein